MTSPDRELDRIIRECLEEALAAADAAAWAALVGDRTPKLVGILDAPTSPPRARVSPEELHRRWVQRWRHSGRFIDPRSITAGWVL